MSKYFGERTWVFDRRWYLFNEPDNLEEPESLFVYGTLRTADIRNVAEIHGKLYDIGVAVADDVGNPNAGVIRGELVYCERSYLESTLDSYEGYPRSYDRVRVKTIYPEEAECWVYVVGPYRKDRMRKELLLPSPACWRESFYLHELSATSKLLFEGDDFYESA